MDVEINGARILATIEGVPLLGTIQITQTVTAALLVMAIITGLCIWLGSGLKVTGIMVAAAMEAREALANEGIDAAVIDIHTVKPLDVELVKEYAEKTGNIVTTEEHSVIGGLGSAVCDVVAQKAPAKVLKIGVNDVFGESGPAKTLIAKYGLDAESIYNKVKAWV